jgi:nucleotide-binding universal stress UspA family protein
MAMTTVLVQVNSTLDSRSAIECAFLAARQDGGHVVGLHIVPKSETMTAEAMLMSRESLGMPGQDIRAVLDAAEKQEGADTQAARQLFAEVATAMQAEIVEKPPNPGRLTACFRVWPEGGPKSIAEQGRVFDLIVVCQPKEDPDRSLRKTLRAVLFHAGRPVLVAPEKTPSSVGDRLLIAWNRSALSARAAAISRNFFSRAKQVGILSVLTEGGSGPTAHDLADYIAWHGIEAKVVEVELGGRSLGDVMLEEAKAFDADLLVMGAYSQSPFRESLTGGVTNYILSHAELPLLLTH